MISHTPRPSGLALGAVCPGSFNMSFNIKEILPRDNSAAERGNMIHALAAAQMTGEIKGLEDEHKEIVEGYINILKEFTPRGFMMSVEETLSLNCITNGMVGTPDAYFVDYKLKELHIFDLKTGYKFVSEYENLQLLAYALGVVAAYEINDFNIHLHIYQPAHFPQHRVDVLTWEEFEEQSQEVKHVVNAMMQVGAPTVAGLHCGNCAAAHECQTFAESSYAMVEFSKEQRSSQLSNEALNVELILVTEARKRLEDREEILKSLMEYRMQTGQRFQSWSLEAGRGFRKWKDGANVEAIAKAAGKEAYLSKLKTPPQLEKEGVNVKEHCELIQGKATIKSINLKSLQRQFKS